VTGGDGKLAATGRGTIVPLEVTIGDEDQMTRPSGARVIDPASVSQS
jgi:hypothetical protein